MRMTNSVKAAEAKQAWLLVDATDLPLGRLASEIAKRLRGKHKTCFTTHVDCGDHVVVINAEKVRLTGNKIHGHTFTKHTGFAGGIKVETAKETLERHPERLLERAVERMLPRKRFPMFKA
ncbi:MAG: 50S ribosomal protein L13, partial [Alphaproteobacteria bacterium]